MSFLFFFLKKNKNLTDEFESIALFGGILNACPFV